MKGKKVLWVYLIHLFSQTTSHISSTESGWERYDGSKPLQISPKLVIHAKCFYNCENKLNVFVLEEFLKNLWIFSVISNVYSHFCSTSFLTKQFIDSCGLFRSHVQIVTSLISRTFQFPWVPGFRLVSFFIITSNYLLQTFSLVLILVLILLWS